MRLRSHLVALLVTVRWRRWSWAFLCTVFVALAARQLAFVNRYAINVMFWDQWDFYRPAFHHQGIWAAFDEQFGPHRQGIGFLLALLVDHLTEWNSRGDAFAASGLIIIAAALAVLLARRCGIRAPLALLGVPLLFLTLRQFEHFVGATNLSHAAMPLVLIMLYGHALFLLPGPKRSLALGVLVFLMLFTGFAQLAGYVAIVIAVLDLWASARRRESLAARWHALTLALMLIAAAVFLHGFEFDRMDPNSPAQLRVPATAFLLFLIRMLGNFFGLPPGSLGGDMVGGLCWAVLAIIGVCQLSRVWREGPAGAPADTVLLFLTGETLLYGLETAAGRAHLGLIDPPAASRYVTLLIPAGLVFLIQFGRLRKPWGAPLLAAYALALVPATLWLSKKEWSSVHWFSDGRAAWKRAYLASHSQAAADQASNFKVYPGPVLDRLTFLEQHRLNLCVKRSAGH
jgi:hypothetical protein